MLMKKIIHCLCGSFAVDGGGNNASRISGPFSCGEKAIYSDMA